MKKLRLIASLLLVSALAACGSTTTTSTTQREWVDYTNQLTFDKDTSGKSFLAHGYGEVVLQSCVDGDTVHFRDKTNNEEIKSRFLAVDTPESTGQIEPWGKKASKFTCDRVKGAKKIVLSSQGETAQFDGNGRALSYVWVDGVLLNLALVQEGLSPYKHVDGSSWNETFMAADFQAQAYELNIWSKDSDPEYYYGSAQYIDLKELKENSEKYMGTKVTVEGIVTKKVNADAYIETTIEGKQYGIYLFAAYNDGFVPIGKVGNMVKVTGILTEFNGSLQLTDLKYSKFKPGEDDMLLLSTGHTVTPREVSIEEVNLQTNPELAQTLVSVKDIVVTGGKNDDHGSFNVYGTVNGTKISLRFDKNTAHNYKDADGNLIKTYEYFLGKTLDVVGIVDIYYENYQIKIITTKDVVIR